MSWPHRRLGDLLKIKNGFAFDSKRFSETKGLPLIRIRDLKKGYTTETKFDGSFDKSYLVKSGDYLIGMDGEFGCFEWSGPDALLNQRVCKLTEFSQQLEPRFVFYGINRFLKEIEEHTTFTTVKHLSSKQIANIEFPLPPLDEQRRIVAILDETFQAIATAKANVEKNLANANAIFSEQLRLEFSNLTRCYGETSLEAITSTISDGDHQPPPKASEGIPFITISDVNKDTHQIDFANTFKVPRSYYSALRPNRKPIKGDVLYTVTGSFGLPVPVDIATEFCFQRHIALVRPAADISSEWMYYLLLSPFVFDQSSAKATGTAQKTVSLAALRSLRVPKPPLNVQTEVATRLSILHQTTLELRSVYGKKIALMTDLKRSALAAAFGGALTSSPSALSRAAE